MIAILIKLHTRHWSTFNQLDKFIVDWTILLQKLDQQVMLFLGLDPLIKPQPYHMRLWFWSNSKHNMDLYQIKHNCQLDKNHWGLERSNNVVSNVGSTSGVISVWCFGTFIFGPQAIPTLHFTAKQKCCLSLNSCVHSFPLQMIPRTFHTDLGNFPVFHVKGYINSVPTLIKLISALSSVFTAMELNLQ